MRPVLGRDGDVAREAARAPEGLGESDGDQRPRLGHEVQVAHPLGLGEVVVQQPVLPLEGRGRVGVERLVPVEEDAALVVQELQRLEPHAGERLLVEALGLGPAHVPVGAHEDHRALRHAAVLGLPLLHVRDLEVVALVAAHLVRDVDDDQRPQRVGRGQVADGRAERIPVRGRVELSAVLVGRQVEGRGDEAVLLVGELVARLDEALHPAPGDRGHERGLPEARPDRLVRLEGVREVDVAGGLEDVLVDPPEPLLRARGRADAAEGDQPEESAPGRRRESRRREAPRPSRARPARGARAPAVPCHSENPSLCSRGPPSAPRPRA